MSEPSPQTLYAKLVASHTVSRIDEQTVLLYCDVHFANEYTSPQAFSGLMARGRGALAQRVHEPTQQRGFPGAHGAAQGDVFHIGHSRSVMGGSCLLLYHAPAYGAICPPHLTDAARMCYNSIR